MFRSKPNKIASNVIIMSSSQVGSSVEIVDLSRWLASNIAAEQAITDLIKDTGVAPDYTLSSSKVCFEMIHHKIS